MNDETTNKNIDFVPLPKQKVFLNAEERIVFYGGGAGAGKSLAILYDNLQGVHDPDYLSVFFRTTTTEISRGLWPQAKKIYLPLIQDEDGRFIGKAHVNEQEKVITFPSGSMSLFSYLATDVDADKWYGSELTKIYFDEFQFRSDYQFEQLRSRNRSAANVQKGIRCTLNPDPNHFVFDWVKYFLDEEFMPIEELSGKTRYYIIKDGNLSTSWDRQELIDKFGKNPQTYTYIPARLADNPHLLEKDPEYMDVLDSMTESKRNQLLLGCWKPTEDDCIYFNRKDVAKITHIPDSVKCVRAWDLAHSEPHEGHRYPDYTASVMMDRCKNGFYYISGNYINEMKDKDSEIFGRIRRTAGHRNRLMLKQAINDGKENVIQVIPQDSGGGKETFQNLAKDFTLEGVKVKKFSSGNQQQQKFKNFESFAAAVENGLVFILEHTFTKESLEWLYTELEIFDGVKKSTGKRKDDMVDAVSAAFLELSKSKPYSPISRKGVSNPTFSKQYLNRSRRT